MPAPREGWTPLGSYTQPIRVGPNRANDTASPIPKPVIRSRILRFPFRICIDQRTELADLAGIGIA
jgi:hypothetical protein